MNHQHDEHRDLVRTITALTTSPFLTAPPGVACFTDADDNITDVLQIYGPEPPRHFDSQDFASTAELSATLKRVSV